MVFHRPLSLYTVKRNAWWSHGDSNPDLLNAIEALYQLSYDPKRCIACRRNRRGNEGETLG